MSRMLKKATAFEILNHWAMALSFIILAATGFGFLFHIEQMIALFGSFSGMRTVHNYLGVVFSISLFLSIFNYLMEALALSGDDLLWLLKGGGYFSKHGTVPPQGRLNTGQKGYYLFLLLAGAAISGSGLVIWFSPATADMSRWILLSHLIHNIAFDLFMLAVPLHIYLATLANPGTFRVMIYGTVPFEWALKHHERWAKKAGFEEQP